MQATKSLDIGLTSEQRQGVINILAKFVADEYVLYTKTRKYHWNVEGPQFNDLHVFFEEQYKTLSEIVDDAAERIRALGDYSIGTLAEFQEHMRLSEQPGENPSAHEMLDNLVQDHTTMVRQLRKDVETCEEKHRDMGTSDFLTGLMQQHEKMAWMLNSFIAGESA